MCADGSTFSFIVRRGSSNNVLIDFQGGGACWNKEMCQGLNTFHKVLGTIKFLDGITTQRATTLLSFAGLRLPMLTDSLAFGSQVSVADWTYIFVPYCTQDIHLGNRTAEYGDAQSGEKLVMHHMGAANVDAVISWVYQNVASPDTFALTGCSAGAAGVLMLEAARAERHYAGGNTKVVAIGDSPTFLLTDDFVQNCLPNWGIECVIERALNIETSVKANADLLLKVWELALTHYPKVSFGIYTSADDPIQKYFWWKMGSKTKWKRKMLSTIEHLQTYANFNSFIAKGTTHCSMSFDVASKKANFPTWAGSSLLHQFPGAWNCGAECRLSDIPGCDGITGSGIVENHCGICPGASWSCPNSGQLFVCRENVTKESPTTTTQKTPSKRQPFISNSDRQALWFRLVALSVFWATHWPDKAWF